MPDDEVQAAVEGETDDPLAKLFETSQSREAAEDTDGPDGRTPAQPTAANHLTTGIEALDRHLGGGIPPGRIVTYIAPPDTQSELLLKRIAATHNCLYLSTLRPRWEVDEEVKDFVQKAQIDGRGNPSVRIEQLDPDAWMTSARDHVDRLEENSVVVIDSINELEELEKGRYVQFVDAVKRRLWDTGSVGLFYGIDEDPSPALRSVTLRRADLIWQIRRSVRPGEVEHLLVITKFRSGRSLTEPVKLELTDEVRIDTSRDIA